MSRSKYVAAVEGGAYIISDDFDYDDDCADGVEPTDGEPTDDDLIGLSDPEDGWVDPEPDGVVHGQRAAIDAVLDGICR